MASDQNLTRGTSSRRQGAIVVAAVVGCALLALFWPGGEQIGSAPPGFALDPNGRPVPLAERFRDVTLLHFWATWCPPCLTEIPALERYAGELAQGRDFTLVMVAVRDEVPKVETFLGASAANALYDPQWEIAHRYGTRQVPETYLLIKGKVVEKFVGSTDWSDPAIRARVEAAAGPAR